MEFEKKAKIMEFQNASWKFVFGDFPQHYFPCATRAIGHFHAIQIMENTGIIMEKSWNIISGNGWKPCILSH